MESSRQQWFPTYYAVLLDRQTSNKDGSSLQSPQHKDAPQRTEAEKPNRFIHHKQEKHVETDRLRADTERRSGADEHKKGMNNVFEWDPPLEDHGFAHQLRPSGYHDQANLRKPAAKTNVF